MNQFKHVAVIGAGISGVAAGAHLKKEGVEVTVFERSSAAGGVCPCYIGLKNNVSTRMLETTLSRFPTGTEDYVSHAVLKDYIQNTAVETGVHEATRYNTVVKKVTKIGKSWNVDTITFHAEESGRCTHQQASATFDAVIVASGHYHAAKVPTTPGLADWKRRWPEKVQHSKGYRTPENASGKNFLLVGGSVSSTDIARELGPLANRIYQSQRNGAFDLSATMLPENGYRIDEVVSYNAPDEGEIGTSNPSDPIPATVTLKSGRKLCDIHHVILCTGYHLTVPFLPHLHRDDVSVEQADETVLVTDGTQFHNLHKDIFYIEDPSLVFVGVPFFTATFTLFEFQAMVVAKVFSGQAKLPSKEAMRSEYNKRLTAKGHGKAFHSLRDQEAQYVNELLSWVNPDLKVAGQHEISGHTEQWHQARRDALERIRALFAIPSQDKTFAITCR
ncbi:dimethylaniline monooxygenase [Ampelomyces quisqualis]|uniref:Dimethylaniline monooxygenase n=1 Tax=Ampelomyces quisqualis TaxID=50730 RepID=A0A6A5QVC4_AMPQU|nr:dimethylaniline monooxygenase [Ampelomyces quisqualis]